MNFHLKSSRVTSVEEEEVAHGVRPLAAPADARALEALPRRQVAPELRAIRRSEGEERDGSERDCGVLDVISISWIDM